MNLFDKLFNRKPYNDMHYINMLDGTSPIYTNDYGKDIFLSDIILSAIGCIVNEVKKCKLQHVLVTNGDYQPQNSKINYILNNPNEMMTSSQFLERIVWDLYRNSNAYILPVWVNNKLTALYPLTPTVIEYGETEDNILCIVMTFSSGIKSPPIPYHDIIHITRNYTGEGFNGKNDNSSIIPSLNLNDKILNSVITASNTPINGVLKYNTNLNTSTMQENILKFERDIQNNKSGILPIDNKMEYQSITKNTNLVDADTLKFIDNKILRNYGVSLEILNSSYSKEQYEAFYQKTIEPLVKEIGEAFTKTLFTDNEKIYGYQVILSHADLLFMNNEQILKVIDLLGQSGALYENEKRVLLGLKPLPELNGQRRMSLNWIDANKANEYQLKDTTKDGENDET